MGQSCKYQRGGYEEGDSKGMGIKGWWHMWTTLTGNSAGDTSSLQQHQPEVQVLYLDLIKAALTCDSNVKISLLSKSHSWK